MKKQFLTAVLVCLAAGFGFSDGGIVLKGAYGEYSFLGIQAGRVYIFTGETFHVFDLKDGKPLKAFGKVGQGPGEYKNYFAFPVFTPERVIVNNMDRCVQFSLNGEHIQTVRLDGFFLKILPLGSGYIGQAEIVDRKTLKKETVVSILDETFKPVHVVYRRGNEPGPVSKDGTMHFTFPGALIDIAVDRGTIYIGDPSEAVSISIFDTQGRLIRNVRREYPKIKISDKDREKFLKRPDALKLAPGVALKSKVTVEAAYPAFHFLKVDRGLIYVFTYRINDGKREVIVLDESGNEVATAWMPRVSPMDSCIHDGKFYFVAYDESLDELVLHAEDILKK